MTSEQLGFGFLADPDLPQPAKAPAKKRKAALIAPPLAAPATALATPAASPVAAPLDAEAMAAVLEQHPDYRLQRRLRPTLDWPGQAQGEVRRVVVLDTETTGLDQSKERIIELALLVVDVDTATGLPVGTVQVYDGLEDPGKPIPKDVVAITGITDADVRGQALDEARVDALLKGADLVVAHNAGFDRPFVEARLPQFAKLPWACSFADLDWKARGQGSAKLASLAQTHGWFYDAHRAEMDCHALLGVLAKYLPPLPGAENAAASRQTGLAALLQAAAHPSFKLSATNAAFEAKDVLKARGYRWNADQRVWQTRLNDEASLKDERAWLKEHVYRQRAAVVQIERLDALAKYSARGGEVTHQQL